MCGIAGIVDLTGERRPIPEHVIRAMARAIVHRGPDEEGFLEQPGLAFASRRLSIVGLADGQQPIHNEDRTVSVVFNGELFDYPEMRAQLEKQGHRFATHCDTEILPHHWEDRHEDFFPELRGQFAFALLDQRLQRVVLARDRFGICPLYWTRQKGPGGDWLLFASEIKALLASGMMRPQPDLDGINHLFTFMALPGPTTCFAGVQLLSPGHYLRIQLGAAGQPAQVSEHTYWKLSFPDQGHEDYASSSASLTDELEHLLLQSVTRRLRADVPVVSYLSGGLDSGMVAALASKVRGSPIPSFTIRVTRPDLDETGEAAQTARHIGTQPVVVECGPDEVLNTYPELIRAAEGPVMDTSCAALLLLAREVHARGYKVALTGEGADEWMAGYPWHKVHRLVSLLDMIPGLPLSQAARWCYIKMSGASSIAWTNLLRSQELVGGHNAWLDIYGMVSMSKFRFFSPQLRSEALRQSPFEGLGLETERIRRWHPLNRELFLSMRLHLPGLLLLAKGDRVAMSSSVETRYPFLDEQVCEFMTRLPPRWKLRGLQEKALLRRLALRWLPPATARRQKAMFRAPFDSFHQERLPAFVEQLLSEESLRRTGYFIPSTVRYWRKAFRGMHHGSRRLSVEMGLAGVLATQLWHHTFIDPSLADLPAWDTRS